MEYQDRSSEIREQRSQCVTPRGVLAKIWNIVKNGVPSSMVCRCGEDGEFDWFRQQGKVYSDSSKSDFSKYVNLHLGRAYDVMSAKDYCELTDSSPEEDKYVKPDWGDISPDEKTSLKLKMVQKGCQALVDALSVADEKKILNIYNSNTSTIEEFRQDNLDGYS